MNMSNLTNGSKEQGSMEEEEETPHDVSATKTGQGT